MTKTEIVFLRNPDYIFRRVVEEMILVPIHQNVADMNCIYTLNDVGAFLWEKLGQPASQADLEMAILHDYDIDDSTAKKDVNSFLSEMEAIGAVQRIGE